MKNMREYLLKCIILGLNTMISFTAVIIYLHNRNSLLYFNQWKEIVQYALVAVIAQVFGLFIIDCWKKEASWLKEAISVFVFYVAIYFIPLGLIWYRHQSNLKQHFKANPEFWACQTNWFSDRNEPDDFICKIRYLMVITMIIIIVYIIKEVLWMKVKNRIRYLVYMGFISISIGVSTAYLTSEQHMLQLKERINIDLYYTMMRIHGMKLSPRVDAQLKYYAKEYLKSVSKTEDIPKRQYDEVLYDIAAYICNSIYDKEMNEEKQVMLDDKFLKMIKSYAIFVQEEGMKCYMGIYIPRDYELKATQWLEIQYEMLQKE